jgi:Protein of unknown function (DUF3891)
LFVAKSDGRLRIVLQQDHADLAAQFASHWGNDKFQKLAPYEAMVIAVGEHDNGWWEYDLKPLIGEDGRPYNFNRVPRNLHAVFYKNGVNRVIAQDEYAGLMVVMHTIGLYNARYGTDKGPLSPPNVTDNPMFKDFLSEMEGERMRLVDRLRGSDNYDAYSEDDTIWKNYKLLQVMDRLSIHYCYFADAPDGSVDPVPQDGQKADAEIRIRKIEAKTYSFAPYPFDTDELHFTFRARYVPDRAYADKDEFRKEMSRAERRMIECKFVNGDKR